jgi:hypothetical protein
MTSHVRQVFYIIGWKKHDQSAETKRNPTDRGPFVKGKPADLPQGT